MLIDLHCHYTFTGRLATARPRFSFEPATDGDEPALDSCVSPRSLRRLPFRLMRRMLKVPPEATPGETIDAPLERFYNEHLFADGPVQRVVLLAFDAYHDNQGRRTPPPQTRRDRGGDIYTSNSLIYATCRQHPQRFLFGASVHPYRENAVTCVEEVFGRGACLLKWIPLHQNIDVADPRTLDVLRLCAHLGLPVLVHYNQEFTLATQHQQFVSITGLLDTLRLLHREGTMPITIVAHVATPVTPLGERRSHRLLLDALLGEFADAPLFADISALTSWGKVGYLRTMARRQDLHAKLIFGTDFPVPLALPRLRFDLGRAHRTIKAEPSWIQQAAMVCRQMRFNEIVFERAAELLPNLGYFARRAKNDQRGVVSSQ